MKDRSDVFHGQRVFAYLITAIIVGCLAVALGYVLYRGTDVPFEEVIMITSFVFIGACLTIFGQTVAGSFKQAIGGIVGLIVLLALLQLVGRYDSTWPALLAIVYGIVVLFYRLHYLYQLGIDSDAKPAHTGSTQA